jgi:HPt (histidine-containing phosphotransfer) domain-containing protein
LFEILNKYLQGENNVQVFEDIKLKESLTVEIDFEENAKKLSLPLEFYQELLEDFCKLLEKEIPKLSEAIEGKDAVNIKEIAHKLKGVAGNLALDSLFDRFKSIEENLQEQQYEKINILLSSIKNIFKKFPCIQK